jgi:hypothetical protein
VVEDLAHGQAWSLLIRAIMQATGPEAAGLSQSLTSDASLWGGPDCAIITRPPHSKLGWMTPRAYARSSASGGAAQRQGSVPRPLATRDTEGSNQPRTLVIAG